MSKFISKICLLAMIGLPLVSNSQTQTLNWLEDINYYAEKVKSKHINPFHKLSESEFDTRLAKLKAELGTLTEIQIETRLLGLTAALGDGHSNYFMMSGKHRHLPLRFKYFGNELRIVAATDDYQHLLGSTLVSINGVETPELFDRVKHYLVGVDNQFSRKVRFEYYLTLTKLLIGLDILKDGEKAEIVTKKTNKLHTDNIESVPMKIFGNIESPYVTRSPAVELNDIGMPGIKLGLIDNSIAYFRFRHYPEFEQVVEQCSALQAKLSSSKAEHFIIDFRGNGGGSFYSGLAFSSCLLPIEHFDWLTGGVVLTDGHTFSAAMSNAVQFKQLLNARVIGESTGGDPNAYSENYNFELPNSKRKLSLSIRYYPFIEQQTDALYPDIHVSPSWQEYEEGVDAVLLKALEMLNSSNKKNQYSYQ
mgnify:CR=1 FL=1